MYIALNYQSTKVVHKSNSSIIAAKKHAIIAYFVDHKLYDQQNKINQLLISRKKIYIHIYTHQC